MQEEQNFYKNLYSSKKTNEVDKQELFNSVKDHIPKLTDEEKALMDKDITIEECAKALRFLPNSKSPGSDGFTAEFYKVFWSRISQLVFDSYLYAYRIGQLSIEQKRSVITLLPKKDKILKLLKNWRPISLLNIDFKILAKLFGLRMKKVLPSIISCDQVGYLKGRYIGQNIRLIEDVIEKCENESGIVAFLDFEKAFDSIEWEFLEDALKLFNFGENFLKWFNIIYTDIEACVLNNGFSSPFFKLSRGCRQGCPLSPYLFIVAVEILACKIKITEDIHGIGMHNNSVKLVQMADDTTVFLKDHDSLRILLDIMDSFERSSGLKLNKGKTEAMWLGIKGHQRKGLGIKWQENQIFSLGTWFCKTKKESEKLNVTNAIEKCNKILEKWSLQKLSLKGRITVVKTFALPKLLYIFNNMFVPETYIKKVNTLFFKFIWEQKPDKVKREVITQNYDYGGLRMVNFEHMFKAMKAMWVKRMLININANWLLYLKSHLDMNLADFIKCTLHKDKIPCHLPQFYQQVFSSWASVNEMIEKYDDPWDIRRQFINYNKGILAANEYFNIHWNSKLYKNKIKMIHDICKPDGSLLSRPQLEQKFNFSVNQMEYNSLVNAIPQKWKNVLKTQNIHDHLISSKEHIHVKTDKFDKPIEKICNKDLYNLFVKPSSPRTLKCTEKWESEFGKTLEWKKYFTVAKIETKAKIQSFQYAIIHQIFPCNLYLSKWKDNWSANCIRCNEIDTINHYFYYCRVASNFWNALQDWLLTRIPNININIICKDVILGVLEPRKYADMLNFVILQGKWYIYCKKLGNEEVVFKEFLHILDNRLQIEKLIFSIKGLERNFIQMYGSISPVLKNT